MENSIKLKLKPAAGAKVDIGQGEYRRQFKRSEEPFTVPETEARLLLKSGVFERAEEQPARNEEQPAAEKPLELAPPAVPTRRPVRKEKE